MKPLSEVKGVTWSLGFVPPPPVIDGKLVLPVSRGTTITLFGNQAGHL